MNNRLLQFLSAENITQAQFADSISVARAGVSHIIAGRNKPGWDFIINTMKRYPDLNIEWLLTGNGRMYKSASAREDSRSAPQPAQLTAPEVEENTLFDFDVTQPTDPEQEFASSQNQKVTTENAAGSDDFGAPGAEYSQSPARGDAKTEVSPASAAKQRKVTKVIVFFDDGTFQEL